MSYIDNRDRYKDRELHRLIEIDMELNRQIEFDRECLIVQRDTLINRLIHRKFKDTRRVGF